MCLAVLDLVKVLEVLEALDLLELLNLYRILDILLLLEHCGGKLGMASHLGGRGLLCPGPGGSRLSSAGRPAALVQTAAA